MEVPNFSVYRLIGDKLRYVPGGGKRIFSHLRYFSVKFE